MLEPVRDYSARHASTLLVFDAVEDAHCRRSRPIARRWPERVSIRKSMSEFAERRGERGGTFVARLAKAALLAPIAIYR